MNIVSKVKPILFFIGNLLKKRKILYLFFFVTFPFIQVLGQSPNFEIRIENESMVSSSEYQFDIMVYALPPTSSIENCGLQIQLQYNTLWLGLNPGLLSFGLVSGTSQFGGTGVKPSQIPNNFNSSNIGYLVISRIVVNPAFKDKGATINQNGLRLGRFRFTNSTGFDNNHLPLLRFSHLGIGNSWQVNIGGVVTSILKASTNSPLPTGIEITNQTKLISPMYFSNGTWQGFAFDGLTNGNLSILNNPNSNLDVHITSPFKASQNLAVRSLTLRDSGSLDMDTFTLRLGNKFNRNSLPINLSKASLVLAGNTMTTRTQNLNIGSFHCKRLGYGGAGTKTLSDTCYISTEVFNDSGSAVLNGAGKLVLKSDSNGSAIISKINNNSIIGNVIIEQYIPGGRRAFRFIANPLSNPLSGAQLRDNIFVTGNGTGTTIIGAENSNGFDYTVSGNPSAFAYNTANGNGSTVNDPGWTSISNGNSSSIQVGGAWRVLIRGDRSNVGVLNGTITTANPVTLDFAGPINDGRNPQITLVKSNGNGFNLLGNPLNSNINAANMVTNANLSSGIWVWNPYLGTRGGYTAGIRTNNFIIPARAGFFLKVNDSISNSLNVGTVSFPESTKVSTIESFQAFKTGNNQIVINLESQELIWDKLSIHLNGNSEEGFDNEDIEKLYNPEINIFSKNSLNKSLAIDQRKLTAQIIPLGLLSSIEQNLVLNFKGTNIPEHMNCYLKIGNSQFPINENSKIPIKVYKNNSADTLSYSLILTSKTNSLQEEFIERKFIITPNPVNDENEIKIVALGLEFNNQPTNYAIHDLRGNVLKTGVHNFQNASTLAIPIADLTSGYYQILVQSDGFIYNLPFIKY